MKNKKARFGLVGIANTLVDFLLYGVLVWLGVGFLVANFISTSAGMALSFTLNRSFVFKVQTGSTSRQIALFLLVTLFGLWALHPIIIYFLQAPSLAYFGWLPDFLQNLVPKGFAILVSLVWNYIWYSKVVFRQGTN